MDPLSIAAGIAGFLGLSIQIAEIISKYISEIKSAPDDAKSLLVEINALNSVLSQLSNLLETEELTAEFNSGSVLTSVIEMCQKSIQGLYTKLSKFRRDKRWGVNMDQLKWPLDKKDCIDQAMALNRYAQILEFSLTVSNCELLSKSAKTVSTELKKHKAQLDGLAALFPVIPEEMKKMNQTLTGICGFLSTLEGRLDDINIRVIALQDANKVSQRLALLDKLSSLQPCKKHADVSSIRATNTGQWITHKPEFQHWFTRDTQDRSELSGRFLCCYGMPGAGKTVITSYVIDYILSHLPNKVTRGLAYVYCDYRDVQILTPWNMLASILQQLLKQIPDIPQEIQIDLEKISSDIAAHDKMAIVVLLLALTINTLEETFICIDALDEIPDSVRQQLLEGLRNCMNKDTRVFLMARPHVQSTVQRYLHVDELPTITILADEGDIALFLESQIQNDQHPHAMDDGLKGEITATIISKSNGMFLLPAMHIRMILEHLTKTRRRKALSELPKDLYTAYVGIITRIQSLSPHAAELGMKTLAWVYFAKTELRPEELQEALSVEIGDTNLDRENIMPLDTILECCLGLIVVNETGTSIRLVHFTLQEYFTENSSIHFSDGEGYLAEICLTYLNFQAFTYAGMREDPICYLGTRWEWRENRFQFPPTISNSSGIFHFVRYVVLNWAYHAKAQPSDRIHELAMKLITQTAVTFGEVVRQVYSEDLRPHTNGDERTFHLEIIKDLKLKHYRKGWAHMMAASGLVSLMAEERITRKLGERCYHGKTPLMEAIIRGHQGMVQLILESPDAQINAQEYRAGNTALQFSIRLGNQEIIEMLLKHPDLDVNLQTHDNYTALRLAYIYKRKKVFLDLLAREDIHLSFTTGDKDACHKELTYLLAWAPRIPTPFNVWAIEQLLKHPACDVNTPELEDGNTPLHLAVISAPRKLGPGHMRKIQLLLSRPEIGISINQRNRCGATPLSLAMKKDGLEEVVEMIKQHPECDPSLAITIPPVYPKFINDELEDGMVLERRRYKFFMRKQNDVYAHIPVDEDGNCSHLEHPINCAGGTLNHT